MVVRVLSEQDLEHFHGNGYVVVPEHRRHGLGRRLLSLDLGALLAGVLADLFGVFWAIGVIGALTALSGIVAQAVMAETLPRLQHTAEATRNT